jgi:hypothetical protein
VPPRNSDPSSRPSSRTEVLHQLFPEAPPVHDETIRAVGHAIAREGAEASDVYALLRVWAEATFTAEAQDQALRQHEGVRRAVAWLETMHRLALDPSYDQQESD